MCGISGFLNSDLSWDASRLEQVTRQMADQMISRGPDDSGVWVDPAAGIGLGFRRLAIIDLSEHGHQPMVSACGRFVIVFNGEIYNAEDLRRELVVEDPTLRFRGHSDTEVLLQGVSIWGIEKALNKTIGMFAFSVWDRESKRLFLARDRLGIKPLYYGIHNETFYFASELKPLKQHPKFNPQINFEALALYFRFNYVPAPYSIFSDIHKLNPGTYLIYSALEKEFKERAYWSLDEIADPERVENMSLDGALSGLESILSDSVRKRMVADVPLGAFLSGGVDSSLVVALMQKFSDRRVKTFSIGFEDGSYNEAVHAASVAKHLGTDHTELYVSPQMALDVVPQLSSLYDEPFADSSQIPTYIVSKLARESVAVALSGDGGDELFAGYNRYAWGDKLWGGLKHIPRPFRRLSGRGLGALNPSAWDSLYPVYEAIAPAKYQLRNPADKAQKFAGILASSSSMDLYQRLVSHWREPTSLIAREVAEPILEAFKSRSNGSDCSFIERMMYMDLRTYLPDDILTKVDRASMGVSLEARVPLLDHRVVEYAWTIPLRFKLSQGQSKYILRKILYQYVPQQLIERPKMGFALPVGDWLKGPLRDWAEDLLSTEKLRVGGLLNFEPIREKWLGHLSGKANFQAELWSILMFQMWREEWEH